MIEECQLTHGEMSIVVQQTRRGRNVETGRPRPLLQCHVEGKAMMCWHDLFLSVVWVQSAPSEQPTRRSGRLLPAPSHCNKLYLDYPYRFWTDLREGINSKLSDGLLFEACRLGGLGACHHVVVNCFRLFDETSRYSSPCSSCTICLQDYLNLFLIKSCEHLCERRGPFLNSSGIW